MSWGKVALGDCCEIVSGATPDTNKKEFWGGDIFWVTPKDLSSLTSAYIHTTPRKITELGHQNCSAKILPVNSVLFSSRAPIGHVAINTVPVCTNQGFKSFVPDAKRVVSKYLFYWLKANVPIFENLGNGATFKEVSKATVSNVEIPLPPLAEQKRIAEVLDKADSLREKRRLALAKLDTLLQSVFLEMFGDPVKNPKGWKIVLFDEVCKTRLGKMLDEKKRTGVNLRPYLRNANVQWNRFDLSSVYEMDFDERERKILKLEYGDLLICEGGDVGRTAIWRNELPECYYQKALHKGRPNPEKATPEFLMFLLWFFSKNNGFKNFVTSVTIAHLTGEKLKKLKIPIPPIESQRKFSDFFNKLNFLKETANKSLMKTENLFQSLQQRAFKGELFDDKVSE